MNNLLDKIIIEKFKNCDELKRFIKENIRVNFVKFDGLNCEGNTYLIFKKNIYGKYSPLSAYDILGSIYFRGTTLCDKEHKPIGLQLENKLIQILIRMINNGEFQKEIYKKYKDNKDILFIPKYSTLGFYKAKDPQYLFLLGTNVDLSIFYNEHLLALFEIKTIVVEKDVNKYPAKCDLSYKHRSIGIAQLYIFNSSIYGQDINDFVVNSYLVKMYVIEKPVLTSFLENCRKNYKEMYNKEFRIGEFIGEIELNGKKYFIFYNETIKVDKRDINNVKNMIDESLSLIIEKLEKNRKIS